MAAYLVLLFAVLSRFVPHLLHTSAWGVTELGGGVLYFGSRLSRQNRWQAGLAVASIAVSDWFLTARVYGFSFHVSAYATTWAWYALVCLGASVSLHRRQTATRVIGAALASSTGFFLWSNGMVWASGTMYPRTFAGLSECYTAGLPFYRNDALSTLAVCGVLFGVPALARRFGEALHHERPIT